MMSMNQVMEIPVPAHADTVLEPGSYHVMLIGIKQDLKPGDRFTVDLEFEKSGSVTVEPEVQNP